MDSGGSGLRLALAPLGADGGLLTAASDEPVPIGPDGLDAGRLLDWLRVAARELMARAGCDGIAAVAIGAAGMASLGAGVRGRLPAALRAEFALPTGRFALAADAVTAYAGALGFRPGTVVTAGTGVIALGTGPGMAGWRRADGWGHLLGDCGGGAWIGRAGLEAALRAHDGRDSGSPALLRRLEVRFGPVGGLPGLLYPRADRPAVLASFAPEVARCAPGDPVAAGILRAAARQILLTAAAARPAGGSEVALTGGLLRIGEPLLAPLCEQAPRCLPGARLVEPEADPLHGAIRIAVALARGRLPLPTDPALLTVD